MTHDEFEAIVAQLIGTDIVRVSYFEIEYGDQQAGWKGDPRFDSLDYGVQLEDARGKVFSITWDAAFVEYGLCVCARSMAEIVVGPRKWDVSVESRWSKLIGERVIRVDVYWLRAWENDPEVIEYPQDLCLSFSNGEVVFISATECLPNSGLFGMMDNILVVFGDESAKAFGLGPHRIES